MKPRILVPFDFSAPAEQALAWAADLRKTTAGEPIQLVHAIDSRRQGAMGIPLDILIPSEEEIAEFERKMVDTARGHDVPVSAKVIMRPSPPGDTILEEAVRAGAQLIVMGTHGRTGLKRVVLGSVAEHVLRHATCPVVTVRSPPDA